MGLDLDSSHLTVYSLFKYLINYPETFKAMWLTGQLILSTVSVIPRFRHSYKCYLNFSFYRIFVSYIVITGAGSYLSCLVHNKQLVKDS